MVSIQAGSYPEHEHAFHVGGNSLRGWDSNRKIMSIARKHLLAEALHLLAISRNTFVL